MSFTSDLLNPLQFAYHKNRSMDGAVTLALFFILQHLDSSNTHPLSGLQQHLQYNINTQKLFEKLQHLSVPLSLDSALFSGSPSVCQAEQPPVIHHRPEHRRPIMDGSYHPSCTASSPMTCVSNHASVELIKFADDTTAVGPGESTYWQEVWGPGAETATLK